MIFFKFHGGSLLIKVKKVFYNNLCSFKAFRTAMRLTDVIKKNISENNPLEMKLVPAQMSDLRCHQKACSAQFYALFVQNFVSAGTKNHVQKCATFVREQCSTCGEMCANQS